MPAPAQRSPALLPSQGGSPSRGCCSSTRTSWARWYFRGTPRPHTRRKRIRSTTAGSPWAAGGCASTPSALPSTQVPVGWAQRGGASVGVIVALGRVAGTCSVKEGCIFTAADTASQFGGRQRCSFLRCSATRRQGSAGDAAWFCAAGQGRVGTGVCLALSKQLARGGQARKRGARGGPGTDHEVTTGRVCRPPATPTPSFPCRFSWWLVQREGGCR